MRLKNEKINIGNGVTLNIVRTDKFKSNLISYYIIRPLMREEATYNALLPFILKRGTEDLNNSLKIERKLEDMYGSSFSTGVNKKGERQVLRFSIESPKKSYVKDKGHNVELINFINSIIYKPYTENGVFSSKYLKQEKENLKKLIESRINEKRSYAIERCIEEMCKNEKFSLYEYGYVEDLVDINSEKLYKHYLNILKTSPIEIFMVGEFDDDEIKRMVDHNRRDESNILDIPREKIVTDIQTKNMIFEDMDINQGKLVMGYRTNIPYEHKLYSGLLMASSILGGSPNSKLFMNVREKESLAYYISSRVYKFKSLMLIDAGIDFKMLEKTIEIVRAQVDDMKKGIFTEEDMDIARKSINSSINAINDSNYLISEFFLGQNIAKDFKSLEEIIDDINRVTKNQIIEAAQRINLDIIYFLRNKNDNE